MSFHSTKRPGAVVITQCLENIHDMGTPPLTVLLVKPQHTPTGTFTSYMVVPC